FRSEALRTSLIFHEDELIQQVNPQVELPLVVEDLRADHPQKAMTIFEGLRQSNALKPISMENAPMGRASLILLNENEARLLLAFHHAVFDGWSMGIFMDDLSSDLRGSTLSAPEYSQADLAFWEQDSQTLQAIQAHIDAMKQEFLNEETVTRLWSTKKESAGNSLPNYDSVNIEISRELAEDLSKLASKAGVTGFAATCTLFGLTLARHTNSRQVRIGTYAATRAIPGLESMMGMLVNPVPLNLEYGTDNLLDTLKDNSRHIAKAQERAVVPFDILVRELAPARTAGEHPLFTIAFSQDNSPARIYEGGGMSLQLLAGKQHSTALDMEVSLLSQENGSLLVTATFNNSRFSSRAITDILKRFRFVAEQAAQHPDAGLNALEIRTPKDISLLSAWNNTQKNFQHTQSLLAPFMDMVSRTPLHCPVSGQAVLSSTEPTYKELLQSIEGLIRVLRNTDIQPGDFVGLHLSPGIDTAIAMLACWGCGAAFFPLAENIPAARLKQQAKTAQAKLILTEEEGAESWKGFAIPALSLEIIRTHPCFPSHEVEHVEFSRNGKDTVACLYFTSGSSGTPKAVQLSHGNLLNRIQWLWHAIPRESQEKWCAKTSISFVDSLCEYLCPLLYGGDLYICSTNEATNPENLLNTVIEQEVTRLTVVPTLLEAMLDLLEESPKDVSKLHHLTTSGEQLSRHLARRCNKLLPHVALYNFYGSTEITADATWHVVDPVSKGPVPIGKPIANTSVAVLDENQRELPHGIPGEIWISGAGTGLGYVAPEDKGFFIHNGAPSFATGDLGMWTHEGELLYLGRKDRQLKIRGQRVEPAETEYALKQLRSVRDAAVFGMSMQNDIILTAAVVPFKGESVTPEGIRASLLSILP
ncbi:MAG: AMP-binding protein, partial [Spirochaetales bacterium]|nr:AMP-binding protein [Spirochaetales bacterium]